MCFAIYTTHFLGHAAAKSCGATFPQWLGVFLHFVFEKASATGGEHARLQV